MLLKLLLRTKRNQNVSFPTLLRLVYEELASKGKQTDFTSNDINDFY